MIKFLMLFFLLQNVTDQVCIQGKLAVSSTIFQEERLGTTDTES